MAPKKLTENPNKKRKATLDSVLSTVERGFADLEGKMDRGFAAVADDITDIKSKMATKDKTSRLHRRHVVPKPTQAYEPEVPVKVREWISPALASPDLMLEAQPPAQPHSGVVVDRPVRF